MEFANSLNTTALVLEKSSDWTRWYEQFKYEANLLGIWNYLDPDTSSNLEPPSRTKPSADIDDEIWRVDYRILAAEHSQQKRDLIRMAAFLWRTISQGYRDSLEKNISTRKQLQDLRKMCKFTIFQQEANLESQIEKLGKGPQGQSHDQWAQAWIGVLISSKEISESVWTEQRLYREFVKTCLTVLPAFGEKLMAKIIEEDASKLKLNEAVRQYSAWASFSIPQTRTSFKGAFATLDGKKQDSEANKSSNIKNSGSTKSKGNKNDRKAPICPCGERHYFNKCEHINVSQRKPGYVEDHKINARIREWFDSNPEKYEKMVSSFEKSKGAAVLADFLYDKESYATITAPRVFSSRRSQDHSVILDTATTNHVFHQMSRFIRYEKLDNPVEVRTGDSNCFIIGTGSIRLAVNTDKGRRHLRIDNVQHIPGFHINIVTYKAFKHGGAYLDGKTNWIRKVKDDRCVAICETSPCGSFLVLENNKSDSLFQTSFATNSSEQKINTATAERWHLRLGHMSHEKIVNLSKNVDGVKVTDTKKRDDTNEENTLCEVCNTAVRHTKISRQSQYKGKTPFQWTHIDLIHEEPGLSNERYIFHFYCQLTKFNVAYVTLDRKQKTLVNCFAQAHGLIKKWGFDIQFVRMDQEAGLQSEFKEYCAKHGIWQEKTPTDTKEPNGAAERSGGWIITVARKLKLQSGLPSNLWPYFVLAAVRILNRTPKKALGYKTPFELVTKRRPDLSGYRIPGSKCYVTKKNIPSLQKQATRSDIGYYISNSASTLR